MFPGLALRALAIWFVILALAVANGLFREKVLIPNLGAVPGMILSGALLSCLVVAVATVCLPWLGARSRRHLLLTGLSWLLLTLMFEFSFGLLRGQTLSELLQAYTFSGGNIWPVVLLVTALSPWLAARFRGWV